MKAPMVKVMAAADEDSAVDIITLAFAADPMARWTWPQARQYLAAIPQMTRAFGGKAFSSGSAFCTDDHAGTALWLPPGVRPDEDELDAVIERTVERARSVEAAPIFEQMAAYHPAEPHWYLAMIGVDPARQGQGHGNALMACALAQCDRDQAPAYLESSNPRNVPFYQRHGFEPLGAIQVGSSPNLVPMLRRPH